MDYFVISFLEEVEKIAEDPNTKLNLMKRKNLSASKSFNAAKAKNTSMQTSKQKPVVSNPMQQNAIQTLEDMKNAKPV